ncbi:hypothetical protein, partial [Escherichia coli]|uniref:hypothetical protein n=1 Tax=Escherichia coli TaxID=562 RepID=UPI000934B565
LLLGKIMPCLLTSSRHFHYMMTCSVPPLLFTMTLTSPSQDTMLLSTFYANGNFYNQCKNNVPQ